MSDYETRTTQTGYEITRGGKTVVVLSGTEGSLKHSFPTETRDAAQDCFDRCFAASSGTTGAAHKCAMDCGLT